MVSGVLAYKAKEERFEPLFFMLDTFHARQSAGVDGVLQASQPSKRGDQDLRAQHSRQIQDWEGKVSSRGGFRQN